MHRFLGLLALMLAIALLAAACGGTSGQEEGGESGEPEPSLGSQTGTAEEGGDGGDSGSAGGRGKEVFTQSCATCHTLSDAAASGTVGPDLDALKPDKEQTLSAIESGPGVMPENLVEGDDADAVAGYVAEATAG